MVICLHTPYHTKDSFNTWISHCAGQHLSMCAMFLCVLLQIYRKHFTVQITNSISKRDLLLSLCIIKTHFFSSHFDRAGICRLCCSNSYYTVLLFFTKFVSCQRDFITGMWGLVSGSIYGTPLRYNPLLEPFFFYFGQFLYEKCKMSH